MRVLVEIIASDVSLLVTVNHAIDSVIQNNPNARANPKALAQLDEYKRPLVSSSIGKSTAFRDGENCEIQSLQEPSPKRVSSHHPSWSFPPPRPASSLSWLGRGQFAVVQVVLPFSSVHLHRHSLSSGTDPSSSCVRKRALPVGAPTEMVLPFAVGFGTLHAAHALASHFFPSIALG